MKRLSARAILPLLALMALTTVLSGCRSTQREDPILRLSSAEALEMGKELLEEGRFNQARRYLSHAFEVEPFSATGREALLLVADSLYLQGGVQNLVQAEAKYRDFLNRFPTSDRAPYAQFQIANTLAKRVERPDRDQTATRQALRAYDELARLYPGSEHVAEAEERRQELLALLGEHEFLVGHFYIRYGLPSAAVQRFQYLLENYPSYPEMDKVYFHMAQAKRRLDEKEEAKKWFERLREEFPESPLVASIPSLNAGAR
jgi:outer membrane protein assembly factor BamD